MKKIFVNLKRFEVSQKVGGICPMDDPLLWIDGIMKDSMRLGLGNLDNVFIGYFLPEALIPKALETLAPYEADKKVRFAVGCQSVFREDIKAGGNFGAFTANRPAKAMKALGCEWALIAHSEERRDKYQMLAVYDPSINVDPLSSKMAYETVDKLVGEEVKRAIEAGMNLVFCVGESSEQKGEGDFNEFAPRVRSVLEDQLKNGLEGLDLDKGKEIVIGYEPIWAIGPGKTPPGSDYIAFVSEFIKKVTTDIFGEPLDVIYGGGLKEENAASIASIETIDGGLVALTKFVQPIGFDPQSLFNIVAAYAK